jgi:hypothetical protein
MDTFPTSWSLAILNPIHHAIHRTGTLCNSITPQLNFPMAERDEESNTAFKPTRIGVIAFFCTLVARLN